MSTSKKRKLDTIQDIYSATFTQDENCVNVNLKSSESNKSVLYYNFEYYGSSSRSSNIEILSNNEPKVFNLKIIKNENVIKSLDISGDDVLNYKPIIPSCNDYEFKLNLSDIQVYLKFRNLHRWENTPTELSGITITLL